MASVKNAVDRDVVIMRFVLMQGGCKRSVCERTHLPRGGEQLLWEQRGEKNSNKGKWPLKKLWHSYKLKYDKSFSWIQRTP